MKLILNFVLITLFLELFGEYGIAVAGPAGRKQKSNCPDLTLKGGRVKIRSRGRIARFRCRRKFMLYGTRMAVCIGTNWSHQPPVCIADGCPDVDVEDNLQMTADPKYKGALLEFTCAGGSTLDGVDMLYCDGTSWNADPPTCLNTEAEKECDFESQDLCGWTQDSEDNFDWIWHTGTTSTSQTGPTSDHTLGYLNDTSGHYLFIETSSPRRPGDVARMYSPMYNSVESGYCFSVWYHMLGPDIRYQVGSLDIYIVPQGQSVFMVEPVFHTQGNKGDRWNRARIEIGAVNSSFQIVIAATRRNSYVSDIAIDDVNLYNCSEDIIEDTTISGTTLSIEDTTYELYQTTEPEFLESESEEPVTTSQAEQSTSTTTTQPVITTTAIRTRQPLTSTIPPVFSTESTTLKPDQETSTTSEPEPEPETTNRVTDIPTTMKQKTTTKSRVTTRVTSPLTTTEIRTPSTAKKSKPTSATELATTTIEVSTTFLPSTTSTSIDTEKSTKEFVTKAIMPTKPSKTKLSTKLSVTENSTTTGQSGIGETTKFDDSDNEIDSTRKPLVYANETSTDNSSSTSTTDLPNVIHVNWGLVGDEDRLPTKPLLIGVGVGVAVGLLIIVIVIFAWIKRKRRKEAEFFEDEMAPIAKNACNEW